MSWGDVMANFMRQNVAMVARRNLSGSHNGSLQPYHAVGGVEFSNRRNKFSSVGMVVSGDAERIKSETREPTEAVIMPDTLGKAVRGLSGNAQNAAINGYKFRALKGVSNETKASLATLFGFGLVYAGLDFPGARTARRKAKQFIDQPEPTLRVMSVGIGGLMLAWAMANQPIEQGEA